MKNKKLKKNLKLMNNEWFKSLSDILYEQESTGKFKCIDNEIKPILEGVNENEKQEIENEFEVNEK